MKKQGSFFLDDNLLTTEGDKFFETPTSEKKDHNMTLRLPFEIWHALQKAKIEGKIKSTNHFIVKILSKLLLQKPTKEPDNSE